MVVQRGNGDVALLSTVAICERSNETDFYPLSPSALLIYGSAKCVVLCMNIGCVLLRVLPTAYPLWNDYRL